MSAFEESNTRWRYFIISRGEMQISNLQVLNEGNIATANLQGDLFQAAEVLLPNHDMATCLIAQNSIPFNDKDQPYFKLKIDYTIADEKRSETMTLPNASIRDVKLVEEPMLDGSVREASYSDIYIYV